MLATPETLCWILRNKFRMQRSNDYTEEGSAVIYTAMQREKQEINTFGVNIPK